MSNILVEVKKTNILLNAKRKNIAIEAKKINIGIQVTDFPDLGIGSMIIGHTFIVR